MELKVKKKKLKLKKTNLIKSLINYRGLSVRHVETWSRHIELRLYSPFLAAEAKRETLQSVMKNMRAEALDQALSPVGASISQNVTLLQSVQDNLNMQVAKVDMPLVKVDNLQGSVRQVKKDANNCITEMGKLTLKINQLEDRERRNNIRITNLPVGIERDPCEMA